ncbi:MAG: hypothetical protein IKS20_03115, partial [Victivallales bacterium]|nr:hypothetical protein [Victivallales bacterium]
TLKSVSLTKVGQSKDTANLYMEAGTYYLKVESSDKKAEDAPYTVTLNNKSFFYTKADKSDDWGDVKTAGPAGAVAKLDDPVTAPGTLIENGWFGYGDIIDYTMFTLESAANLQFNANASGKFQFSVCSLSYSESRNKYTLKAIKTWTAKNSTNNKALFTISNNKVLEKGTYYICMKSCDKKGNADYSISIGNDSVFYTKGDNSDDMPDKSVSMGTVAVNLGTITAPGALVQNGWVGSGDANDVAAFTLNDEANLSFDFTASDACKFIIYKETEKNGKYNRSAKLSMTIKNKEHVNVSVTSKNVKLEAGTYYLVMEATYANQGSWVDYAISVNQNSAFANANQLFGSAAPNDNLAMGLLDFQLEETNDACLALDDHTGAAMASFEPCGEIALPQLTAFSAPAFDNNLAQDDCLLGISGADEQKFNPDYNSLGMTLA